MWCLRSPPLGRGGEWLLTRLRTPWKSLNGCSLGDAILRVPDCAESGPQSLNLAWRAGGGGGGGVWELTYLEPNDLHRIMVPRGFLSPDIPYWGPAKGAALFWVWCARELGPNGCRNLDRDTQREVKTYFILTQVGHFC
jgi:hypothetical protein